MLFTQQEISTIYNYVCANGQYDVDEKYLDEDDKEYINQYRQLFNRFSSQNCMVLDDIEIRLILSYMTENGFVAKDKLDENDYEEPYYSDTMNIYTKMVKYIIPNHVY